jgi:hypothetical protein
VVLLIIWLLQVVAAADIMALVLEVLLVVVLAD